jgi:hypothetical protein
MKRQMKKERIKKGKRKKERKKKKKKDICSITCIANVGSWVGSELLMQG